MTHARPSQSLKPLYFSSTLPHTSDTKQQSRAACLSTYAMSLHICWLKPPPLTLQPPHLPLISTLSTLPHTQALRQQPWAASLVNGLESAAAAYSAPPTSSTPSAPHIAAATVDGLEGLDEAPTPSTPSTLSAQSVGNLDLGPLFVFLGQFYGWWACLVWSVVACGTLAVHRLGLSS